LRTPPLHPAVSGRVVAVNQLSFVNYAKTVQNGLQIGSVNIMTENAWFV